MVKEKKKQLESKFTFDKKTAMRLVDASYYQAQARDMQDYEKRDSEKKRLATPRRRDVTILLQMYKSQGLTGWKSPLGKTLQGIYRKNKESVAQNTSIKNTNLLQVLAKPETLLLAYREIRGNKGALTPEGNKEKEEIKKMSDEQYEIYIKSNILPDGFSLKDIYLTSKLIRTLRYPWGTSSQIYFDKPGVKNKKRPITIPPFMDRVVQKAIEMILQAIYEPVFEQTNRSFGFRPNKGVHDAIVAITSKKTNGMRAAVEGDIEAAYDTVDKKVLIDKLSKKITDSKFIRLMEQRLNYEFVEKETGKRLRPDLGIPQGGIDSPYLFNIYLSELDEFVEREINGKLLDQINNKLGNRRIVNPKYSRVKKRIVGMKTQLMRIKRELKDCNQDKALQKRKELFDCVKKIRLLQHQKNTTSNAHPTKRQLRGFYVRYADDWIWLTNGTKEIAEKAKNLISNFLLTELKLKLSATKTLVTNITKEPAKFLGFEVKATARGNLMRFPANETKLYPNPKRKWVLHRKSGLLIWLAPDRQRLISRLHMKGFCDSKGFPREVPWLSTLEAHVIVERFNAVIAGLGNYYLGFIRNNSHIQRWIYILRYSCLKTLAQKYKTSIKGVFKKFGHNQYSHADKTIQVKVSIKYRGNVDTKNWTLLTYSKLVKKSRELNLYRELESNFWDLEKGRSVEYKQKKGRVAKVTNENYLDAISWTSLRTKATLDLPCSICGNPDDVEMHHIRHIRKRSYALIPETATWQQVMALRNRKQIPVCRHCHKTLIHPGKYQGIRLTNLPHFAELYDNRIVHPENWVQPSPEEHHGKSLEQKGWKPLRKDINVPEKELKRP